MTQEKRNLAKNFQDYRNLNGLNQMDFSFDCGMNKDTLSLIERCKENVTLNTLHALAGDSATVLSDFITLSASSVTLGAVAAETSLLPFTRFLKLLFVAKGILFPTLST